MLDPQQLYFLILSGGLLVLKTLYSSTWQSSDDLYKTIYAPLSYQYADCPLGFID